MSNIIHYYIRVYCHYTCGHTIWAREKREYDPLNSLRPQNQILLLRHKCPSCPTSPPVLPESQIGQWGDIYLAPERYIRIQQWIGNMLSESADFQLPSGKAKRHSSMNGQESHTESTDRKEVRGGKEKD